MKKLSVVLTGFMLTIVYIFFFVSGATSAIEAEKNAPLTVPRDERLQRVEAVEEQVRNMQVRQDHPRIFVNAEILPSLKTKSGQIAYANVIKKADSGDYMNAAMAYLLTGDKKYAQTAYNYIKTTAQEIDMTKRHFVPWIKEESSTVRDNETTSCACLAFDWAYNGLDDAQRTEIVSILGGVADISNRYQAIVNGYRKNGETFHREEWAFYGSQFWCEIALAHHHPDAEAMYKAIWAYDWYWGDALRMYAYAADGTPFEGYYRGNDGVGYFVPLFTATGIDVVNGWIKNAAYHLMYRLDVDNKREIFHHGVSTVANINSYNPAVQDLWKNRTFLAQNLGFIANDPYAKGILDSIGMKPSPWIMDNVYYASLVRADVKDILTLLFYDESVPVKSVKDGLSPNRYFPNGNELYVGTGWANNDTRAFFRTTPAYTKSSHGDYDVNSWGAYKNGQMLSGDTGFYDAYEGQSHYMKYQKNTVAHNNILLIDPAKPDEPKKSSGAPDPGGTEFRSKRAFSSPNSFGINSVFVHSTPTADWADIAFYEEGPGYVYAIGAAHKAYGARTTKYNRHFMWIPDGDNAWIVIYDDLEYQQRLIAKDLVHMVTAPLYDGQLMNTEVEGHIFTIKTHIFSSLTFDNAAAMEVHVLLPTDPSIRFVGGEGYEYWVDGTTPKNHTVVTTKASADKWSGLPWQNMGTWRAEILGDGGDFFKVIHIGDSTVPVHSVQYIEENGSGAVFGGHKAVFNGERLVLDNAAPLPFPEPPAPSPEPVPQPPATTSDCPSCPACPDQEALPVCKAPGNKRITASQFSRQLKTCYERALLGDPCEIFHSIYKEIFELRKKGL